MFIKSLRSATGAISPGMGDAGSFIVFPMTSMSSSDGKTGGSDSDTRGTCITIGVNARPNMLVGTLMRIVTSYVMLSKSCW